MIRRSAARRALGRGALRVASAVAVVMSLGAAGNAALGAVIGRVVVLQQNPLSAGARRCLTRVREELVAGGFDVTMAEFGAGIDPLWVIDPKNQSDESLATIALVGEPELGPSELWIVDRVGTGRSAVRRIMVPSGDAGHAAEVVAIRALEFLRASTLELVADSRAASRPAMVQAARPAAPAPPQPQPQPRGTVGEAAVAPLAIEAGVSMLASTGALDAAIIPVARLRAQLAAALAARMTLAGLGSRPKIVNELGSATVAQDLALLELAATFRTGARLRPLVSAGAGALVVSVDGVGSGLYEGHEGRRWSALFDGGIGIAAGVANRVNVALELHAMLAAPYPTVRFGGTEEARIGRPSLLATLTVVAPL
jgi:hypothetical protein